MDNGCKFGDVTTEGSAYFEFEYPRNGLCKSLIVSLLDVRAADSVRVSYDFDRDGWKIEQAQFFEWETNDKVCDPGWIEVVFIQAWGSKKEVPDGG